MQSVEVLIKRKQKQQPKFKQNELQPPSPQRPLARVRPPASDSFYNVALPVFFLLGFQFSVSTGSSDGPRSVKTEKDFEITNNNINVTV